MYFLKNHHLVWKHISCLTAGCFLKTRPQVLYRGSGKNCQECVECEKCINVKKNKNLFFSSFLSPWSHFYTPCATATHTILQKWHICSPYSLHSSKRNAMYTVSASIDYGGFVIRSYPSTFKGAATNMHTDARLPQNARQQSLRSSWLEEREFTGFRKHTTWLLMKQNILLDATTTGTAAWSGSHIL